MMKTMAEMTNKELFCVLSGSYGVMSQMYLRDVIKDYKRKNEGKRADLQTMVQAYLSQEETIKS